MNHLKKQWVAGLALLLVLGGMNMAQARVTEKVDAMIAENSPLKVNDTDLWVQIGYPLIFGLQYDKYATANMTLGLGVGSYMNGFSLDMAIKYLFLTGKFSPFVAAGPVLYYTMPTQNIIGVYGTAGLQYIFDGGMGLSLGVSYVSAVAKSQDKFSYPWVKDSLCQPSAQFGFHWNY